MCPECKREDAVCGLKGDGLCDLPGGEKKRWTCSWCGAHKFDLDAKGPGAAPCNRADLSWCCPNGGTRGAIPCAAFRASVDGHVLCPCGGTHSWRGGNTESTNLNGFIGEGLDEEAVRAIIEDRPDVRY